MWGTTAGGTGNDVAYSVDVDDFGNAVVSGSFSAQCKFAGSAVLSNSQKHHALTDVLTQTLYSKGGEDVFVPPLLTMC